MESERVSRVRRRARATSPGATTVELRLRATAELRRASLQVGETDLKHLTLGRIKGVELGLHYSWIFIAALITLSLADRFRTTNPHWSPATVWASAAVTGILFFVGLFAHELSHAMVAKARGLPIHRITLFFLGGVAQIEREAGDPGTEFWMAIAGPAASVVFGFACLLLAWGGFGWPWWSEPASPGAAILVWLGYINFVLAGFNLIPGFPMDGGRVLRAILWWITKSEDRSTSIAARVGQLVGWGFIAWGLYGTVNGAGIGELWIAFIGWFLIQAAGGSLAHARMLSALRGLTVRDVMSRDCVTVDGNVNLESVAEAASRGGPQCFLVEREGKLDGLVDFRALRRIAREQWPVTPLRAIMRPLSRVRPLRPDMPATEALDVLGREDLIEVPVIEGGFLQGIVSRNRLVEIIRNRAALRPA